MDGLNFKAREEVCEVQAVRSSLLTSSSDEPSSSPSTIFETPPESMAMEWTDEKHSLYLKSMEASFVNELYDSMELLGWSSYKKDFSHSKSSNQTRPNTLTPSAQFKVLRSGCWRKVHFDIAEQRLVKTNETNSKEILSNPWILHFASSGRNQGSSEPRGPTERVVSLAQENDHSEKKKKKVVSHWGGSSSKHFRFGLSRRDLLTTDTEASDQNFVDEDKEGEKVKRAKTRKGDSANDQVVPLRKS